MSMLNFVILSKWRLVLLHCRILRVLFWYKTKKILLFCFICCFPKVLGLVVHCFLLLRGLRPLFILLRSPTESNNDTRLKIRRHIWLLGFISNRLKDSTLSRFSDSSGSNRFQVSCLMTSPLSSRLSFRTSGHLQGWTHKSSRD